MDVIVVPCLSDNYAYLVVDDASREAFVVDPSEAGPVEVALARAGARLVAILATHHHFDHVGGNEALAGAHPGLRVYAHGASPSGRVPAQTDEVTDGDTLRVAGRDVRVLQVPGHTLGAVAFVIDGVVFTGDTLFTAGCGRMFEGTPEGMHRSLSGVLARLDPATRVYPGHEYTVQNLLFSTHVEPHNRAAAERLARANELRSRGEPTIGGTIGDELATNPFLRTRSAEIRAGLGLASDAPDAGVFAALRKLKDGFRG